MDCLFDNILVVCVLYKKNITDSETLSSLKKIRSLFFNIILYDNSPEPQESKSIHFADDYTIEYIHDPINEGIAKAYNFAFLQAIKKEKKWLLLLDQDSDLTEYYFQELKKVLYMNLPEVVSIIPKLTDGKQIISPTIPLKGGYMGTIEPNITGEYKKNITALNSLNVLNVEFLKSIGGFPKEYPLDLLDHYLFKKIVQAEKAVYILPVILEHHLSVSEKDYISLERYTKLVLQEVSFYNNDLLNRLALCSRLSTRIIKFIFLKRYSYLSPTIKALKKLYYQ